MDRTVPIPPMAPPQAHRTPTPGTDLSRLLGPPEVPPKAHRWHTLTRLHA
jgi:hypothetical protein